MATVAGIEKKSMASQISKFFDNLSDVGVTKRLTDEQMLTVYRVILECKEKENKGKIEKWLAINRQIKDDYYAVKKWLGEI